jgi:hypothetical protein
MDTSTNARPWAIRHQGVERVQPLPMAGLEESDTSAENVVPDWRGSLGAWIIASLPGLLPESILGLR